MGKPDHFIVKNWTKFQHYKDRNPPWIKLHVEILASEDWVTLADASKLLAVVCMIIAAKNDGRVPNNPDYIKRVAYLDKVPNLTPLVQCGFLSNPLADASESKRVQADARPETEAYSTETEDTHTPRAKGSRLAPTWKPSEKNHSLGRELNLTDGEIADAATRFREYFHSPDAARPVKKDWDGAFSRWLRTDAPKIVSNRNRGQRPQGNAGNRASATSIRDKLRAEAGLQPEPNLDALRAEGGSWAAGTDLGQGYSVSIIDADFTEGSDRFGDGDASADEAITGRGIRSIGPSENLHQQTDGVPLRRGAPCSENTAEYEPLVALVAGASGAAGDTHLQAPDDADGLDIPTYLRRTA